MKFEIEIADSNIHDYEMVQDLTLRMKSLRDSTDSKNDKYENLRMVVMYLEETQKFLLQVFSCNSSELIKSKINEYIGKPTTLSFKNEE